MRLPVSLSPATIVSIFLWAGLAPSHAIGADTVSSGLSELHALSVVATGTLADVRGGAVEPRDIVNVQSIQTLRSEVNGNAFQAGQTVSGSVTFASDALGDFRGVGLFNIVTGNLNAVDAAIGVTFNLR